MTHIKLIVFDLSEVLVKGLKGVEYTLEKILFEPAPEINKKLLNHSLQLLFLGNISEDEYIKILLEETNRNISKQDVKNYIRNNFTEIPGTRFLIKKLKEKGYKIALLSIHAKEWVMYCNRKYMYHELFDYVLYSFDTKLLKPDKKSFLQMMRLANLSPENIIFIDDNEENIESARQLGIHSLLFTTSNTLEKDLVDLGLF